MDSTQILPVLDAEELRVLGTLIEKARATPDYYPMTLNSLTAACNQKTSRNPVVNYDEETVALTLNSLKKRGLISTATGGSSRTVKFKHNFAIVYPLIPSELAVICLLLLRGPQTPGEINTNSGRLFDFDSLEEVQEVLDKLSGGEQPFIMQLPRRPGQKEARYAHLLGGIPELDADETAYELPGKKSSGELEERLSKVELELAELKEAFANLMREL